MKSTDSTNGAPSKIAYYFLCVAYCALIMWVFVIRAAELMSLVAYSTTGCFLVVLTFFGMISLFVSPTTSFGYMLRRFALIALVRIVHWPMIFS